MTIRDRKQLKQTAARRLKAASYSPRRLFLIHSGIMLAVSVLLAVCNYIVVWQIDAHGGGLDGIRLRSALEAVSSVLSVIYTIAMPFWSLGLVYASLRLARGKAAWPGVLLEGFRRRRPVIRYLLLQILIYGVILLAAIYGAWMLYMVISPTGQAFAEALAKLMASGITDYMELLEQIPEQVMEQVLTGYLPVAAVITTVMMLPALYRLRLSNYLLMERDGLTPWQAIRTSGRVMRRNCFKMLWLDLSFWWYYLVSAVLLLPAYADVLLQWLGVSLPVDMGVVYICGTLLYTVLELAFQCLAGPKVQTTYALAYEALMEQSNAAQKQEG